MKRTTLKERNAISKPFGKLLFPSNTIINFNKADYIDPKQESDFLEWIKKEATIKPKKMFSEHDFSRINVDDFKKQGCLKEWDNERKILVTTEIHSDSQQGHYKMPNLPHPKPRKITLFEWIISKINLCFSLFECDELAENEILKIEIDALKSKNAILMSKLNQLKQK